MALKYQFTWLDPLDLLIFPRLGRMPWGPAPRVHGDGDGSRLCWWSPGRGGTGCRRHSVNVEHTTERELFRCDSIAGPHHSWRCSRLWGAGGPGYPLDTRCELADLMLLFFPVAVLR